VIARSHTALASVEHLLGGLIAPACVQASPLSLNEEFLFCGVVQLARLG